MARLHVDSDGEEEFPEISTVLMFSNKPPANHHSARSPGKGQNTTIIKSVVDCEPELGNRCSSVSFSGSSDNKYEFCIDKKPVSKQKPLRVTHINTLLLALPSISLPAPKKSQKLDTGCAGTNTARSSPGRTAKQEGHYNTLVSEPGDRVSSEDGSSNDLEDFVIYDSTTDEEVRPQRSPRKDVKKFPRKPTSRKGDQYGSESTQKVRRGDQQRTTVYLRQAKGYASGTDLLVPQELRQPFKQEATDIFHEEPYAILKFSPPRSTSPHKPTDEVRFVTPPSSPSKPKLQSPSKMHRVPPSPHRPSIDAFWSQDVINDWNDQYSPRKTPLPRIDRRLFSVGDESNRDISPSNSPRKSPTKSPVTKNKRLIELKKVFDDTKHDIGTAFLSELDQTITSGQVNSMAESTGGIRVIWSKKLNSTAGRANWKREGIRTRNAEGVTTTTSYRHHASIELAEKVIDDEDRLINVIAHEYCHLANFMISGVKNNPHGKEFKEWATKCSRAFSHRGIKVTTKHSYTISYKYIWACTSCSTEYQRHSKSIDPARHTCGSCKSALVQIQPPPRKSNKAAPLSGYQAYVKENYARVRRENPGVGQREVMGLLGRGYREGKVGVGDVVEGDSGKEKEKEAEVEVVEISSDSGDDDDDDDGAEMPTAQEEADLDSVARKLDFLTLGNGH